MLQRFESPRTCHEASANSGRKNWRAPAGSSPAIRCDYRLCNSTQIGFVFPASDGSTSAITDQQPVNPSEDNRPADCHEDGVNGSTLSRKAQGTHDPATHDPARDSD